MENDADEDEEEEKVPDVDHEENAVFGDDSEGREVRRAARLICAFISWTCPNCNYSYAEKSMPNYKCYCGTYEEPPYNPMTLPHSCGEYCGRKRHEHCTHAPCDLLCHPGSCPPCGIKVPVACHCGKEE